MVEETNRDQWVQEREQEQEQEWEVGARDHLARRLLQAHLDQVAPVRHRIFPVEGEEDKPKAPLLLPTVSPDSPHTDIKTFTPQMTLEEEERGMLMSEGVEEVEAVERIIIIIILLIILLHPDKFPLMRWKTL